jgi:uncharacterized membrane protein YdjX (TVP38/TMEM64 family)
MTLRILLKGLALIASLILLVVLVRQTGLADLLSQQWIDSHVRGQGLKGELLFVALAALATAIGVPRQGVAFLGGFAFGVAEGTVLGVLATVLGASGSYLYAQWFAHDLIAQRFPQRLQKLRAFLSVQTFQMALVLRLLPVGSNVLANLAAGACRVPALPFLAGSALGFVPQTLIFALIGSGVQVEPLWRIGSGVVLFLISGLIGVRLYQRIREQRHYDAAEGEPR